MVKKAQFFSLDAFLALSIFIIAMVLLYSFSTTYTPQHQQYYYADDIVKLFSSTKIEELDLSGSNLDLSIYNDKTIDETIRILMIKNQKTDAENLVKFLIEKLIPEKYGVSYNLGEQIYISTTEEGKRIVSRSRYIRGD